MADWCGANNNEAGMFATPSRVVRGQAAGDAARGDCARNIRETASMVSAYRNSVTRPPPGGSRLITLRGLNSNKCVDAPSYNNGVRIHVWDCE